MTRIVTVLSFALVLLHGRVSLAQFGPPGSNDQAIMAELKAIRAEAAAMNAATNARIDALAARVDELTIKPPQQPKGNWQKMSDAWDEAIRTGKPLVVWSGNAICPGCVAATTASGEWVNLTAPAGVFQMPAGPWPPSDAITVLQPDGPNMYMVGTYTDFGTVAQGRGHLWTVRQALRRVARVVTAPVRIPLRILGRHRQGGMMAGGYGGGMMSGGGG